MKSHVYFNNPKNDSSAQAKLELVIGEIQLPYDYKGSVLNMEKDKFMKTYS